MSSVYKSLPGFKKSRNKVGQYRKVQNVVQKQQLRITVNTSVVYAQTPSVNRQLIEPSLDLCDSLFSRLSRLSQK
jgi:hypothetical protein